MDPSLITQKETRYMGVDLDRGAGYGNTLTWTERDKPKIARRPVEIQLDLDKERFYDMFVKLMSGPAHGRLGNHIGAPTPLRSRFGNTLYSPTRY